MTHNTRVKPYGSISHVAVCSCGWVSETRRDKFSAENDATDHVVEATKGEG